MGEIFDKLKGKAKKAQEAITGDRSKKAEGALDEAKGKAKEKFEDLKQDIKRPEEE
jgi:uncharacterized protein YjbJ (UPF0337 family)